MDSKPLVVDLDGTLIKTDLLWETANQFSIRHPFQLFKLLVWLGHGKSTLKAHLAKFATIDPALLPYNDVLLSWLQEQKKAGRRLVLATASHSILAQLVAKHLCLFDEVLATDDDINLKAEKKRDCLIQKYGESGFDYVGNSVDDLPIWQSAECIYVVSSSTHLIKELKESGKSVHVFEDNKPSLIKSIFNALRPYQWTKNLLIFIPLVTAHLYTDSANLMVVFFAFFIFNMTASSVYVLNDLIDITDDRLHVRKRHRVFAAGNLSLMYGWVVWPMFLVGAFLLTVFLMPLKFLIVLSTYYLLTLAYSSLLKQKPILDVLTLAALYTLRIIAGAAAIPVPLSFWLLAFSMFLFTSLAFIKRFSELRLVHNSGPEMSLHGRDYSYEDLQTISNMGTSAGYISVLVLALYIQDVHTAQMYSSPKFIWLACPLLLYWISRAWLLAHRGNMHDDPIIFALKDKTSWIIAMCFVVIFALARIVS
ncbi:UbiA family prenyltransferase [uncultured Legionella sp.]|uniref:UbiA family prenyltransferase n=1 Tax=uncultured Legionella sp. TaxID=210934 RepID=UPI00262D4320|nr:UbiA family prenyltransferase [uncultured Legionella sp.]